jgi:hypothetical protein
VAEVINIFSLVHNLHPIHLVEMIIKCIIIIPISRDAYFRNACSKSITQHKKIVKFFFKMFLGIPIDDGMGFSCEKRNTCLLLEVKLHSVAWPPKKPLEKNKNKTLILSSVSMASFLGWMIPCAWIKQYTFVQKM